MRREKVGEGRASCNKVPRPDSKKDVAITLSASQIPNQDALSQYFTQ